MRERAPAPVGSAGSAVQGGVVLVDVVTNSGYGLNPGTGGCHPGVHRDSGRARRGHGPGQRHQGDRNAGLDVPAALDAWVCHPSGQERRDLARDRRPHNIRSVVRSIPPDMAAAIGPPRRRSRVGLCARAASWVGRQPPVPRSPAAAHLTRRSRSRRPARCSRRARRRATHSIAHPDAGRRISAVSATASLQSLGQASITGIPWSAERSAAVRATGCPQRRRRMAADPLVDRGAGESSSS